MGAAVPQEIADGLWRWTARHPEWHPGVFGAEVASFALAGAAGPAAIVDPQLDADDPDPVLELLADLGDDPEIVVTIPYHVRSAQSVAERLGGTIFAHAAAGRRLTASAPLTVVGPDDVTPGGASFHRIGKPRRQEQPVYLPSHRALAFGDAVVEVDGELRMWCFDPLTDDRVAWYRKVFASTLAPLLELDVERILVTHGAPVLSDGRAALARALQRPPWRLRG